MPWPWHFNNFMSSTAFVIAPNSVRVWGQKETRLLWDLLTGKYLLSEGHKLKGLFYCFIMWLP